MGSRVRTGVLIAVVACAALISTGSLGQSQPQSQPQSQAAGHPPDEPKPLVGDPVHGKAISYTCLGCHGVPGYRNAYPNYSVPKLEGQHPEYLVIALQAYRAGDRSHITMHAQASSLSDQDMTDIAAYFAGEPIKPRSSAAAPQAAAVCVACHGQDGVGITPQYPSLAGQHEDYLERALHEYRKGGRKNPIMATFAGQLKEDVKADDVRLLARYYSQQRPGLKTEERPSTVLTAHQ